MDDLAAAMARRQRLAQMVGGGMVPQQNEPPYGAPDLGTQLGRSQLARTLQPPQQQQQFSPAFGTNVPAPQYDPKDYMQNMPYHPNPNAPPMQDTPMPYRYDPNKPVDPNMLKLLRGQ